MPKSPKATTPTTLNRAELIAALEVAKRCIGRINAPILHYALIKPGPTGGLYLHAIGAGANYGVRVALGWTGPAPTCLLPVAQALKVLKVLRDDVVTLATPTERSVKLGPVTLCSVPAEEFPAPVEPTPARNGLTVPTTALRDAFDRVLYAASTDETRFVINGVCLTAGGALVTTDGHRLAVTTAPEGLVAYKGKGARIATTFPRDLVQLLQGVLKAKVAAPEVQIDYGERDGKGLVSFTCGAFTLTDDLMDGEYPDYVEVIPRDADGVAIVVPRDGSFHLDVGINPRYLVEALDALPGEGDVKLFVSRPLADPEDAAPFKLVAADDAVAADVAVIMPCRK